MNGMRYELWATGQSVEHMSLLKVVTVTSTNTPATADQRAAAASKSWLKEFTADMGRELRCALRPVLYRQDRTVVWQSK